MKLSWSHKLFIQINIFQGRFVFLDYVMIFIAHALVFILLFSFIAWSRLTLSNVGFWLAMSVMAAAYAIGYMLNYTIALLYRHQRPIKELPNVKLLVRTMGTWKTFPSDHAMTSIIPAILAIFFHASLAFSFLFTLGALCVAASRVYVGVHYPRDVVGGLIVGIAAAIVSYTLIL